MSMRNWPEYGIGLVFTNSGKIEDENEISYIIKKMGYEDEWDLLDSLERDEHTWRYYDCYDVMDGMSFYPFAEGKHFDEEPEQMLVVWALKGMQPFKAAYSGPEEIRNEFIEAIGEYLPDDFDWDAHIGEFSLTICC